MTDSSETDCPIPDPRFGAAGLAQIEAAAQVFATDEEIAAHVGISVVQLNEFYRGTVDKGYATGRLWIRQKLFELAKGGDAEAQKILARTYLTTE